MKATGMQKIILCALMSVILILTLAACGGTATPETQPPGQKELEQGQNARNLGAYNKAIEYFEAAGDIATEDLKQTVLEFAANYSQNQYECGDAAKPLAKYIPSLITPEEGYPVLEQLLWEWLALETNSSYDYREMEEYANAMLENGYPAEELQGEILYNLGRKEPDINNKKDIWARAAEGTPCRTMADAIALLQEGNLTEGAALLAQVMDNEPWAKNLYSEAIKEYREHQPGSLNEKLTKDHAYEVAWDILCAIAEDPEDIESSAENAEPEDLKRFFNNHMILVGIDKTKDSIPLTEADRQDMETLCGTKPNGKLIILHKRQIYGSNDTNTDVNLYHMNMLPDEFYPDSLEEVEFVVLLETTYRATGRTYSGGTKEIRETTKLTLYNAATGKKLLTASANSTPTSYLYYSGSAPIYHSGESPVMNKAMQQVLEKIRSTKTNQ